MNRLLGLAGSLVVSLVVAGSSSATATVPLWGAVIEHWDGTAWTQVATPPHTSYLGDVVAVSAEDAWAFGSGELGGLLALHWDGSAWHRVAVPAPKGTAGIYLRGAAVESATDIWVVGFWYSRKTRGSRTLIEHWNGKAWKVVPSPIPRPASYGLLYGVTALSPRNAWAVGRVQVGSQARTLILHWNGKVWKRVASPNPFGRGAHFLAGVAAVSARDVWAIGSYLHRIPGGAQRRATLVLHWNGKAWKGVRSPNPGGLDHKHELADAAASSAGDVWAVGDYRDGGGDGLPLTEHWSGEAWTALPAPGASSQDRQLLSVSPLAADDVWAAGFSLSKGSRERSLVLHWDGEAWSVVPTPEVGTSYVLTGVAAISPNDVWAVGSALNDS